MEKITMQNYNPDDISKTVIFIQAMKAAKEEPQIDELVGNWVSELSIDGAFEIRKNILQDKNVQGALSELILSKINARFGQK